MIDQWNVNYVIHLEINPNEENVEFRFSSIPDIFDNGDPNFPAQARTEMPVEEDILDGYKYYEHTDFGITHDWDGFQLTDGIVYFNNTWSRNFDWTTSTTPDGNYMLGTVILHELGHVLSMGHIEDTYVDAVMKRSYYPADVLPILTDCDKSGASYHYANLYGNVIGVTDDNSIAITSYPDLLDENQQYTFNAEFYRGDPNDIDFVQSWNWKIRLYHEKRNI